MVSNKILFLIGIQILVISTSFIVLESIESQKILAGNSVNVAGKNRYFIEMTLNNVKNYYIGGNLTGDPISTLALYEKNSQLLKIGGTQNGITLSPLNGRFQEQWNNINNLYLDYKTKIQNFVESNSTNHQETKLIEISNLANNLVEQNDILTDQLVLEIQKLTTELIWLEISLAMMNVGIFLFLLKIIYNIMKKQIGQLIKLEKDTLDYKKYRSLYDGMPDLCRTINEDGIITDCNTVYASTLGYTKEEVIGKSIFDFVAKSYFEILRDRFEEWKRTGNLTNREIWLQKKDGSIFPSLISTTNLYDENEKRIGGNSVIIDMTSINEAKSQYNDLYDENPDLLSTVNPEGILLNCNKTYATVLGYTKEELIGKHIFDYVADNSIENAMASFSSFLVNGRVRDNEIWIKRKDGSIFPSLVSANGRFDKNGKLKEGVVTIKDVTDLYNTRKKLMEKEKQMIIAEEKSKNSRLIAIGETASRLGHDLRNPLSVIMNTVEILKLKSKNDTHDENIIKKYDMIERAIARMSHQIEDVLDFVRIKPLELDNHSINEILKEASDQIITSDNVKINLPQNDLRITCDSKKLEIVFINILTNAVQAMDNKGEIDIKLTNDEDNMCISIEDSGPGIPDDILPNIFDPLFTTKQTGTGLGLVSCKNIIEQHGGNISVKNNPTTFTISLPVSSTDSSEVMIDRESNDESRNISLILYYEETLAKAARNYAHTEDKKWEQRYNALLPLADKLLKDAIKTANENEKEFYLSMDKMNLDLVEMETKAIELVNIGQAHEAIKLLESEEYERRRDFTKQFY